MGPLTGTPSLTLPSSPCPPPPPPKSLVCAAVQQVKTMNRDLWLRPYTCVTGVYVTSVSVAHGPPTVCLFAKAEHKNTATELGARARIRNTKVARPGKHPPSVSVQWVPSHV